MQPVKKQSVYTDAVSRSHNSRFKYVWFLAKYHSALDNCKRCILRYHNLKAFVEMFFYSLLEQWRISKSTNQEDKFNFRQFLSGEQVGEVSDNSIEDRLKQSSHDLWVKAEEFITLDFDFRQTVTLFDN